MISRLSQLFPDRTPPRMPEGLVSAGDASGRAVLSRESQLVITGRRFEGQGGGDAAPLPLTVLASGVVVPGRILGAMPTISGTALDAGTPPALSIPSSGTRYVIATVTGTAEVELLDSRYFFHQLMTGIAVAISLTSAAPVPADLEQTPADGATATFKIHLATFVNGVKTAQICYGPITGYVADAQNGTGKGQLDLTYTAS